MVSGPGYHTRFIRFSKLGVTFRPAACAASGPVLDSARRWIGSFDAPIHPSFFSVTAGSWASAVAISVWLGLAPAAPAAEPSILTPEGLFRVVTRVAERSGPRIGSVISADYPALTTDLSQLIMQRYPTLYEAIYNDIQRRYPMIYSEAADYVYRRAPSTYRAFQQDLVRQKADLVRNRLRPSDVFWARIETQPPLKIELMNYLNGLHPELVVSILARIDRGYPALKLDLFKLIAGRYPGLLWEVGRIWTAEAWSELRP